MTYCYVISLLDEHMEWDETSLRWRDKRMQEELVRDDDAEIRTIASLI